MAYVRNIVCFGAGLWANSEGFAGAFGGGEEKDPLLAWKKGVAYAAEAVLSGRADGALVTRNDAEAGVVLEDLVDDKRRDGHFKGGAGAERFDAEDADFESRLALTDLAVGQRRRLLKACAGVRGRAAF